MVSGAFPLGMRIVRRSVLQKGKFDLYQVAPIQAAPQCKVPAFFVHGEQDNFVSPKHALNVYEAYGDSRKEILLVPGDHNSPRPGDSYNYISTFFHRYLLPDHLREKFPEPLRLEGNQKLEGKAFFCKQVRGMDHYSKWPFNVMLCVGQHSIELYTPYTQVLTHTYRYQIMNHVYMGANQPEMLVIELKSGQILGFYTSEALMVYQAIAEITRPR